MKKILKKLICFALVVILSAGPVWATDDDGGGTMSSGQSSTTGTEPTEETVID